MSTNYTHSGSDYTREEWEASARYAEEHAAEWRTLAHRLAAEYEEQRDTTKSGGLSFTIIDPPQPVDLAQHIFQSLTQHNRALAAYWRSQQ